MTFRTGHSIFESKFAAGRQSSGLRIITIFLFALAALLVAAAGAHGQAANFVSFQRTLPITLSGPTGVALDGAGNMYIADTVWGEILKTSPLSSGAFAPPLVVANLPGVYGLAVDRAGNVYATVPGNANVYLVAASGAGYAAPQVIATLTSPMGIAVDGSFNLYVADSGAKAVYQLTPSGGGYASTAIGSGWSDPVSVAVDGFGDVYVADFDVAYIVEEVNTGGVYHSVNLGNGDFAAPSGVAVDFAGNVFVVDFTRQSTFKLTPTNGGPYVETKNSIYLGQPYNAAVDQLGNQYLADYQNQSIVEIGNNFGSLGVGQSNSGNNQVEANFIFNTTATVGGNVISANGNPEADFFALPAPQSNCNAGTTYTAGQLCAVFVGFTPTAPGLRMGSIALTDQSGNVISVAGNFSGFGIAPRAGILPGTWNKIAGGIAQTNFANAIALDGNNSIYTVASNNVYVTTNFAASWTQVFDGSVHHATGAAVDASGNVFVSTIDGLVFECVPGGGGYAQTAVVNEGNSIQNIVLDGNQNLFLIDSAAQAIEEAISNGTGYTLVTLTHTPAIDLDPTSLPYGIAVDGYDDIFVSDYNLGRVYAGVPQSNGSYVFFDVVRGLDAPLNLLVDPAENLYVGDTGLNTGTPTIYQAHIADILAGQYATTYNLFPMSTTIASYPLDGLAMDAAGNFYVTDNDPNGSIYQINLLTDTVNFAPTALGTVSADSPQSVWLANTGNASLAITVPGVGQNPSLSNNFLLGAGGTEIYPGDATPVADCPVVDAVGAPGALADDSICSLAISFEPMLSGPIAGQVVVTDNSLNRTSQQVVSLNGIGQVEGTTTSVSSSLNPSNYGVQVTLTAVVTQTSGTLTPTGSLQFKMNGNLLGSPIPLVDGVAEYASNQLPAGTDHITAIYTPNSANYSGSTSGNFNQVVNADTPSITLVSSENPAYTGQSVTFTVNVAQAYGTIVPTGAIQFTSNGINIGTPINLVEGQASYTTSSLPSGTDSIVANFTSTNTSINSGAATLVQTVNINVPVITLISSVNPSVAGQLVTFNVVVAQAQGALIPTGTIQFTINGAALGMPITLVSGTASVSSNSLPNGVDTIVASFTSSSVNFANGSATLVQTVNINVPVIGLTSSLNPSNYGQDVTFNVTIGQAPGAPVPSGTVQFTMNGNALGTPYTLINGTAGYATNNLPAGKDVITAIFTSANQFYASSSVSLTQTVNIDTPSITLSSSLNPSTYGQPVTFNAVIAQAAGTIQPAGSVQFFGTNGGGNIALTTPLLLVNGIATFSTSALTAGTWQISVVYTSTSPNFVSGEAALTQIVNKVTPIISITTSANPIFVTNPITLVGSVSGYATNIGTLTFYDGTTVLWSGAPAANGIELQLPNLAVGAHLLSVSYSGNANVSAGTSTVINELVEDFSIVVATAPTKPVMSGDTATYTFTFTPIGPLTSMPADINLALTGAPPDSIVTLTPNPVANGSGTTTVTFLLKVSPGLVELKPQQRPGSRIPAPLLAALLLLPFATKLRKAGRRLVRLTALFILIAAGATTLVGLSGCGQSLIPEWVMTLTATSGALQHSVDVSIRVQ